MIKLKRLSVIMVSCLILFNSACRQDISLEIIDDIEIDETQYPLETDVPVASEAADTPAPTPTQANPIITINNVAGLAQYKQYFPFYPDVIQISSNGAMAAVGNLKGVKIMDLDSGELRNQIDTSIPICNFGFRKNFQFNDAGTFLGIAFKDKIQVWQVGGGMIYESPYQQGYVLDLLTCGLDIPQLALSPSGTILAESSKRVSARGMESYFQIIDILKNTIIFEWEGEEDQPHGQLYGFQGLGFSSDGFVLQTFDPTRYSALGPDYKQPFRFWSTATWQELDPLSEEVQNSFPRGDLMFGRSLNDSIKVVDKITGKELQSLQVAGCRRESPCLVKFSPDGSKIVVLGGEQTEPIGRVTISSMLTVYDRAHQEKINDYPVKLQNLDGVWINNDGEIRQFEEPEPEGEPIWWSQMDYFSGFRNINDDLIAFTPQIIMEDGRQMPSYSASCGILLSDFSLECQPSLLFDDGISVSLEKKDGGVSIYDVTGDSRKLLSDIKDPDGELGDTWRFRLIDYAAENGKGFLCVDRNSRQDSCFIMNMRTNQILHEGIDFKEVQHTPQSQTAAFIDRTKKSLFLYNLETDELKQMKTYKAVALPVSPVFLSDGKELVYLVQGLENKRNNYIEKVDATLGKVIKRYDIEGVRSIDVSSLAVSKGEDLWAVADTTGRVFIIDPLEQSVIHTFRAADEGVVDLEFSQDGRSIIAINPSGVITIWVVKE